MSVISRLPHIPADEITRALDRTGGWTLRVEALRPGDASWVNLSNVAGGDWVVGVATQGETQDQVVGRFTVTFLARADGRTVAPGVSAEPLNRNAQDVFAPFLYAGTFLRVYAGNAAAGGTPTMRFWIRGRTEKVEWPGNDVVLHVNTPDAELDRAWITTDGVARGAEDPGVPLATEIQSLLNDFGPGDVSLRVLPDDGFPDYALLGVGPYVTSRGSLRPFLHQLARRPGADLRYVWDEAAGEDRYTLYLPPRHDTTVRFTLDPARIQVVPLLEVSSEFVRNDFEVEFPDTTAKGGRRTLTDEDLASQQQFGRAYMFLGEGDESSIRTPAAGANLLAYAKHDLAQPPTDLKVRIPFLPWLTLHDVGAIQPDGVRFDYLTTWAVSGLSHNVQAESQDGWYTEVSLRGGSPVGQYYGWFNRAPMLFGDTWGKILKARLIDDRPTEQDWELLVGPGVYDVSRFAQVVKAATVATVDPFALGTWIELLEVLEGRVQFTVPKPAAGFQRYEGWLPLDQGQNESGDGVIRQIDPVEVSFGEKLVVVSVVDGLATVRASMASPSPSSFPIAVSIHVHSEDNAAVAAAVFGLDDTPYELVHSGLVLPLRELLRVIARFEAVDGTVRYARVAIDRDALANGYVTVDDWRVDPTVLLTYDDDADFAQLTLPDGRTITWTGLTGSGTIAYEVGETTLDNGSTESLLKTDEVRGPYTMAVRGGGVWVEVWKGARLHGPSSTPPTLRPETRIDAETRDKMDIRVTLTSPRPERIGLKFRDSDDLDASTYILVPNASDPTPRFVESGTQVVETAWFDSDGTGPGEGGQKLNNIPLLADQIKRVYLQAYGEDSEVHGPWVPVVLSLMERPWLESLNASLDPKTGQLRVRAVGGGHMGTLAEPASVYIEADADTAVVGGQVAMDSPVTYSLALYTGGVAEVVYTVPSADRSKVWTARATPYNGPISGGAPSGLAGTPMLASTSASGDVGANTNPYLDVVAHIWELGNRTADWTPYELTLTFVADYDAGVRSILLDFSDEHGSHTQVVPVSGSGKAVRLSAKLVRTFGAFAEWLQGTGPIVIGVTPRDGSGAAMGEPIAYSAGDPGINGGVEWTGGATTVAANKALFRNGISVQMDVATGAAILDATPDEPAGVQVSGNFSPDFSANDSGMQVATLVGDSSMVSPEAAQLKSAATAILRVILNGYTLTVPQGNYAFDYGTTWPLTFDGPAPVLEIGMQRLGGKVHLHVREVDA